MPEELERSNHIDLQTLERYLDGNLEEWEYSQAERHLEGCPMCRIELRFLERFRGIDEDEELLSESRWEYAEAQLDRWHRAFVDRVGAERGKETPGRGWGFVFINRWLAPIAAASILVMIFMGVEKAPMESSLLRGVVMRGSETAQSIEPVEPSGEISGLPERFVWRSSGRFESYDIEVFSSNLETVFEADGIKCNVLDLPDSLKALIKPGVVYIWKVKGYRGVEPAEESQSAWFTIKEDG